MKNRKGFFLSFPWQMFLLLCSTWNEVSMKYISPYFLLFFSNGLTVSCVLSTPQSEKQKRQNPVGVGITYHSMRENAGPFSSPATGNSPFLSPLLYEHLKKHVTCVTQLTCMSSALL